MSISTIMMAVIVQAATPPVTPPIVRKELPVIFFAPGSADVSAAGRALLRDRLNDLVPPVQWIDLLGSADRTGSSAHNQALSVRRAEAVAQVLIELGADPKTIRVRGRGEVQVGPSHHDAGSDWRARSVDIGVLDSTLVRGADGKLRLGGPNGRPVLLVSPPEQGPPVQD